MLIQTLIYAVALDIGLHFFYQNAFNELKLWKNPDFKPYQVIKKKKHSNWLLIFQISKIGCFDWILDLKFYVHEIPCDLEIFSCNCTSRQNRNTRKYEQMCLQQFHIHRILEVENEFLIFHSCIFLIRKKKKNTHISRSWHGSLNKWIVRYLYIPLGGKHTQLITIWFIFGFIGLWHDLKTRWLAWSLTNCIFFTLEIAVLLEFQKPKVCRTISCNSKSERIINNNNNNKNNNSILGFGTNGILDI